MTDRESLFREEALEFRARSEEMPGAVVRLGPPWLRWSYRLTLVLIGVGVALAVILRTSTTTSGDAFVNGHERTFAALLPAVVAPDLRSAEAMRVELKSPRAVSLRVIVTSAKAVAPNVDLPGLPRPEEPAILLRGRVVAPTGRDRIPDEEHLDARATVVLRTERLGGLLLRQLKSTLSGNGTGT